MTFDLENVFTGHTLSCSACHFLVRISQKTNMLVLSLDDTTKTLPSFMKHVTCGLLEIFHFLIQNIKPFCERIVNSLS